MSHTIDAANGKVYKAKEGRAVRIIIRHPCLAQIIIRHPCLAQIIIRHPCLAHIKIFSTTNLRFPGKATDQHDGKERRKENEPKQ
jgi:hypothetical protein